METLKRHGLWSALWGRKTTIRDRYDKEHHTNDSYSGYYVAIIPAVVDQHSHWLRKSSSRRQSPYDTDVEAQTRTLLCVRANRFYRPSVLGNPGR